MAGLSQLLQGSWTNNDLKEIRSECTQRVRVQNAARRSEHLCVLKMKTPKVLTITVQSECRQHIYSLDVVTRDLLVPIYKNASLLWLRLFFGKALEGLIPYKLNFLTMDEIKVNSYFLRKPVEPPGVVTEEDSAALLLEVSCEQEGAAPLTVALQIPKILEEPEIDLAGTDEYTKDSQKLHEMLFNLEQENARTRHQLQQSQQDILKLKSEVDS